MSYGTRCKDGLNLDSTAESTERRSQMDDQVNSDITREKQSEKQWPSSLTLGTFFEGFQATRYSNSQMDKVITVQKRYAIEIFILIMSF